MYYSVSLGNLQFPFKFAIFLLIHNVERAIIVLLSKCCDVYIMCNIIYCQRKYIHVFVNYSVTGLIKLNSKKTFSRETLIHK